eukprot:g207.t1
MEQGEDYLANWLASIRPNNMNQETKLDSEVLAKQVERVSVPDPIPSTSTIHPSASVPPLFPATKQELQSMIQDTVQQTILSSFTNLGVVLKTALGSIEQRLERIEAMNHVLKMEVGKLEMDYGGMKNQIEKYQSSLDTHITEVSQSLNNIVEKQQLTYAHVLLSKYSDADKSNIKTLVEAPVQIQEDTKSAKKQTKKKKKTVQIQSEEESEEEEEPIPVRTTKKSSHHLKSSPSSDRPPVPQESYNHPVEGQLPVYQQQQSGSYGFSQPTPSVGAYQQTNTAIQEPYNLQTVYGTQTPVQQLGGGFQTPNLANEQQVPTAQQQYQTYAPAPAPAQQSHGYLPYSGFTPMTDLANTGRTPQFTQHPQHTALPNYNHVSSYPQNPVTTQQRPTTTGSTGPTTQTMSLNQVINDAVNMGFERSLVTSVVNDMLKHGDGKVLDMNVLIDRLTTTKFHYT